MNDWGSGKVKAAWSFTCGCHHTHQNGADNDLNFYGINEMNITMNTGVPYDRKSATILAKMILRAGAYQIIFHDPKVRNDVQAARDKYAHSHPGVISKLGAHYAPSAMYDTPDLMHSTHFHTHWYVPPQNNVPADVKVWITDQSKSEATGKSKSCHNSHGDNSAGPYSRAANKHGGCTQAPAGHAGKSISNPLSRGSSPYNQLTGAH
jgi:hypothetical protein